MHSSLTTAQLGKCVSQVNVNNESIKRSMSKWKKYLTACQSSTEDFLNQYLTKDVTGMLTNSADNRRRKN